jgi:hypothetical protein
VTTPLSPPRLDRGTVVATVGLALVAAYLALLAYGMRDWPYDRWMLLILAPLLVVAGMSIIVAVTRHDIVPLTRLVIVAFVVKLASSFVRYFVTVDIYGTGDSLRYDRNGATIANSFHAGDLPLSGLVPTQTGTPFVDGFTGLLYTLTGPSRLGGFLVFSWLSFFGLFLFLRAALLGLPEGDHRRYALLVLFLPSMLFWPSSIGKEALMMLALGACAYGAARILERRRWGWLWLAFGLGFGYLVRPTSPSSCWPPWRPRSCSAAADVARRCSVGGSAGRRRGSHGGDGLRPWSGRRPVHPSDGGDGCRGGDAASGEGSRGDGGGRLGHRPPTAQQPRWSTRRPPSPSCSAPP